MSDPRQTVSGGWPDLRATYDTIADAYAAEFREELAGKPFDRAVLTALVERLPRRGVIADVGCGPAAQVGVFLQGLGRRVVGVDLSPVCAARAPLPAAAGNLAALPLRAGSVQAVVCFYALIHLPRTDAPGAVAELRRVLAPGGRLVVAVHGGSGEITQRGWYGRDVEFRATLFERSELFGLLAAAGFQDVKVARRGPYPQEHPTQRLYATASA